MPNFYIGWDVGAWKCGKGKDDSCDAIVVMDDDHIIGFHRDNLGSTIRHLHDTPCPDRLGKFIRQLFALCNGEAGCKEYSEKDHYYIAIDTPLGWPRDLKCLLNSQLSVEWEYQLQSANIQNTLLYRYTEREKLKGGMSVIVDSIGSQSTKGMLLLQLLQTTNETWGIWKSNNVTLFETYPKACLVRAGFVDWMTTLNLTQRLSETFKVQVSEKDEKPKKYGTVNVIAEDVFDAAVCACVARAFAKGRPTLVTPMPSDPEDWKAEGWIFYPDQAESFVDQTIADGHKEATCCVDVTTFHEAVQALKRHLLAKQPRGFE